MDYLSKGNAIRTRGKKIETLAEVLEGEATNIIIFFKDHRHMLRHSREIKEYLSNNNIYMRSSMDSAYVESNNCKRYFRFIFKYDLRMWNEHGVSYYDWNHDLELDEALLNEES